MSERLKRLQAYGKAASGGGGQIVGKLLKFNKGDWYAGKEEEELAEGTKMIVNVDSALAGWTRWEDNRPVEQDMGQIIEAYQPKRRADLGHNEKDEWEVDNQGVPRDPWQFSNQVLLKSVKGSDYFTFITSSKGGINALGRMIDKYVDACMERGEDILPVVALGKDSYNHAEYKKIWVPTFTIVDFVPVKSFGSPNAPAPAKKSGSKELTY